MNVLLALVIFIAAHVIGSRSRIRPMLVRKLGERGFTVVYSVLSTGLLAWVIFEVIVSPRTALWPSYVWSYYFTAAMTFISCGLIGVSLTAPNPLSLGLRKKRYNPDRPGMVGWIRHPLLLGFTLWGAAHIPSNGFWPGLVLFLGITVSGFLGTWRFETRMRKKLGEPEWLRFTAGNGHVDGASALGLATGVLLWVFLLWIHPLLFGKDPGAILQALILA